MRTSKKTSKSAAQKSSSKAAEPLSLVPYKPAGAGDQLQLAADWLAISRIDGELEAGAATVAAQALRIYVKREEARLKSFTDVLNYYIRGTRAAFHEATDRAREAYHHNEKMLFEYTQRKEAEQRKAVEKETKKLERQGRLAEADYVRMSQPDVAPEGLITTTRLVPEIDSIKLLSALFKNELPSDLRDAVVEGMSSAVLTQLRRSRSEWLQADKPRPEWLTLKEVTSSYTRGQP